ncbi:hypothetical protein LEP1GSC188_3109 [Leptospira weilii serovar Topaz str. LT2116]|uniref:MazG nucleotide pyrophosphohydrolase domain protein n=1 Tax=Leptospira weilii serovar Topaz str. LT2116 TaxID=1088540 RepID=M3G4K1_9LEPT|nr:hypothetical protein LEP1GSC188_3109 [Leptospira weilii serovar Topaz str. LT2116]
MIPNEVFEKIILERIRQESLREEGKFKYTAATPCLREELKLSILVEEVGEVAKCLNESQHGTHALEKELIQIMAVCLAWLESDSFR